MRAYRVVRQFCVAIGAGLSFACGGGDAGSAISSGSSTIDETLSGILESSWDFYLRSKIFLGPTYFGNTTSFGRNGTALHALALTTDYTTYRALATKGLIELQELNVSDAPPGVFANAMTRVERAATVSLTDEGAQKGLVDGPANTVTFTFGNYRVAKIAVNTPVAACEGTYRLVEGTRVLEIKPGFEDIWAELGWSTNRDSRFRALFKFDTTDVLYKRLGQEWSVTTASNGRFSAQDTGPLGGNYESDNVPPTIETIAPKVCTK